MKAQNTTIREFLDGAKQFVIPVFQRDYTWEEGNWRQLWEDICRDGAENGFNQAAVRLNKFVREQQQWTATEMEKRGKQLAERALRIWPYPRVS